MLKEFKGFAMRGSVIDMAVGIIIGAIFGAIVKSLVDDVLMPPIDLLLGNVDFSDLFVGLKDGATASPYVSLAGAENAGAVAVNYGVFVNSTISLVIMVFFAFLLIRGVNRLRREAPLVAWTTKECPYCLSTVALKATRCPQCTSELK